MSVFFPQINSNCILTQLPYTAGFEFDTVSSDMETGMRWAFSRRDNTDLPDDYAQLPLGRFQIQFPMITDAEAATLLTFFQSMCGRYGAFQLLDPGGNLVQSSEDFTALSWDLTNGPVGIPGSDTDPFGGSLATILSAAGDNSFVMTPIGPVAGGMTGFVMCASAWVKANSSGQKLMIGFIDSSNNVFGTIWTLPEGVWMRIYCSATFWSNNEMRFLLGGYDTWEGTTISVFGVQVAPTKGEGAYVRSPDNYGYHPNCRFDTDMFQEQVLGPNQRSVVLPMFEFNNAAPDVTGESA
jgi:hypothetical protein